MSASFSAERKEPAKKNPAEKFSRESPAEKKGLAEKETRQGKKAIRREGSEKERPIQERNTEVTDTNYSDIGSSISDVVQKAIDTQDFGGLSETIQDMVGTAVTDAVRQGMGAVGDSINRAADQVTGRAAYQGMREAQDVPYWRQPGHERAAAQQPWKNSRMTEAGKASGGEAELYSPGGSSRLLGYFIFIVGLAGTLGTLAGLLAVCVAGAVLDLGFTPVKAILILLMLACGTLCWCGSRTIARVRRFKNYVKTLGKRTSISIKELANANGRSEKGTLRDISGMLEKQMFLQGHLDDSRSYLFVTNESYEAWRAGQKQAEAQKTARQKEQQQMQQARSALPEEVRKLIEDGDRYIQKIRESNDAIQDEAVSAKLDGLEAVTRKIFEYVEKHPESVGETKKLMRYYLPTTIKLLDAYRKLTDEQLEGLHPEQNSNMEKSKKQIEDTLDTLNIAFARLFDQMYQDTSMEISADISVLKTLLAKEGLTESEVEQALKGVNAGKQA